MTDTSAYKSIEPRIQCRTNKLGDKFYRIRVYGVHLCVPTLYAARAILALYDEMLRSDLPGVVEALKELLATLRQREKQRVAWERYLEEQNAKQKGGRA